MKLDDFHHRWKREKHHIFRYLGLCNKKCNCESHCIISRIIVFSLNVLSLSL